MSQLRLPKFVREIGEIAESIGFEQVAFGRKKRHYILTAQVRGRRFAHVVPTVDPNRRAKANLLSMLRRFAAGQA